MKNIKFILAIVSCTLFSSCGEKTKEDYKKEIYTKREAEAEVRSEDLDKEIAMLEAQLSKYPKTAEEKEVEQSDAQKKEMEGDNDFFFNKGFDNKDKYKKIKHIKLNLSSDLSEINGKYRLYKEAKKINAVGIVNYNVKFPPFVVSGDAVIPR